MRIKIQRVIFAILTILTFIMIFIFSSQSGEKSGSTSRGVTRKIIEILQIDKNMDKDNKELLIENCQHLIRKLAHFTIYAITGINMTGFIDTYNINKKKQLIVVVTVGFIYAILDEFHQTFSGSRTPAAKDVIIDTLGVLFGMGIFNIFRLMFISDIKMENISCRNWRKRVDFV